MELKDSDFDDEHPTDGALLADGFEEALIGFGFQFTAPVAVYDRDHCIRILMEQGGGISEEDAEEYFEFNVAGAWVGPSTPVFLSYSSDRQPYVRIAGDGTFPRRSARPSPRRS